MQKAGRKIKDWLTWQLDINKCERNLFWPAILCKEKNMAISELQKVNINNSTQWILVRGKSIDNPLIIHVQAGPGLPMIPEANAIEKLLHLEEDYLVAYWDQRGCGKSFDKNMDPKL